MYTFIICFLILIASYFIYGKIIEKIVDVDENNETPAYKINDGVDYNRFPDGLCKFDDHGRLESISKYQDRVLEITPGNYYPVRFYTNSFTYDLIPEVKAVDHPTAPASIQISLNTPNLADTTGAWSAEIEIDEQYLDYNSH